MVRTTCIRGILIVVISLSSLMAQMTDYPVPIGFNMVGVHSWSRTMFFADRIKSSQIYRNGGNVNLDANGWPTHDANFEIYAGIPNAAYHGDHLIAWEGTADVSCNKGTVRNIQFNTATRKGTAILTIPKNTQDPLDRPNVRLYFNNTSGGVKNVKVMLPGHTFEDTFNKAVIAAMHNANIPVVRFMDYLQTNHSVAHHPFPQEQQWNERRPRNYSIQSYYYNGNPHKYIEAAWEYIIEFANEADIDPWINIPVNASDDYIRQLAKLFAANLEQERIVYTEYGNENWNYGGPFKPQAEWVKSRAAQETGPGPKSVDIDPDGNPYLPKNAVWDAVRYAARRNMEIGSIFVEEFGEGSRNTRVRPLMMQQRGMNNAAQSFRYITKHYGPVKDFFYASGGATYFFFFPEGSAGINSEDDLFAGWYKAGEIMGSHVVPDGYDMTIGSNARKHYQRSLDFTRSSALCRYYGIKSFAYEGSNGHDGPEDFYRTAHRSERNIDLLKYVIGKQWHGTGNDLWMWFQFSQGGEDQATSYGGGNFGALWYPQDTQAGKYQGIQQLMTSPRSALDGGIILPQTVGSDTSIYIGDNLFDPNPSRTGPNHRNPDNNSPWNPMDFFLVNAKQSGTYELTYEIAPGATLGTPGSVDLKMNTRTVATFTIAANQAKSEPVNLHLEKGMHTLAFSNNTEYTDVIGWNAMLKSRNQVGLPSIRQHTPSSFNGPAVSYRASAIHIENPSGSRLQARLITADGRTIISKNSEASNMTMSLKNLPRGMYVVQILQRSSGIHSQRIVH